MGGYQYPTTVLAVSDSFQDHVNRGSVNPGTDYRAPMRTPVYAPCDAEVVGIVTNTTGSGGRMLYLDTNDGNSIDLLHLDSFVSGLTANHMPVKKGQLVAYSGRSGTPVGGGVYLAHLHISIRHGHGNHSFNRGNFDFDAMMKAGTAGTGGTTPISEEEDMEARAFIFDGGGSGGSANPKYGSTGILFGGAFLRTSTALANRGAYNNYRAYLGAMGVTVVEQHNDVNVLDWAEANLPKLVPGAPAGGGVLKDYTARFDSLDAAVTKTDQDVLAVGEAVGKIKVPTKITLSAQDGTLQ